ncbi:MAG: SPFH domain-containing protein [Candidatus Methanomethylophilaceae archaeon]|nr:SPFH domain-containing protein [Candidatus Methanomethylophilaceae archaeon]MDY5872016.1 SPFH domain-containing protein [Candidatus Methanomethylophilaceae archaeon]
MAERTNVISWSNPGKDDLLWEYDQEYIRTLSSLTVNEWQWAVFIRDGQILRVFDAGRYELTTANFPFLTKIYEKVLGYKEDVFKAKVIFISKKQFQGKWGVRTMCKVAQNYEAPIPLMGNGDFTYRVSDPETFITQMIGGGRSFDTASVATFMRSFINEQIAQQLGKQYYMDVYGNLDGASLVTKMNIEEDFKNRGLELLSFKIGSVSTEEAYQKDIYEVQRLRTDVGAQYKQFEVMERMADAVGNSSGGAAVGTGMMLFPQMMQQLNQQAMQNNVQQQQPKVMCPSCGGLNDYPYKFCSNCGQPSPQMRQQQPPMAQPAATPAPTATTGAPKAFKICPFCGESLAGLPRTPKYCPYCSEQLN